MLKRYRVYKIAENKKTRQAVGIWQGIKDNITFIYFDNKLSAELYALELLNTTKEGCIAVEDLEHRVLKIIYRDKIDVLTNYDIVNTKDKSRFDVFKALHKNYTLEKTKRGIIAFAYSNKSRKIRYAQKTRLAERAFILAPAPIEKYKKWAFITAKALIDFYGLPDLAVKVDILYDNTSFEWNSYGAQAININLHELHADWQNESNLARYKERLHSELKTFKDFLLRAILHEVKHYKDLTEIGVYKYNERKAYYEKNHISHDNREIEKEADYFAFKNCKKANFFIKEILRGGN